MQILELPARVFRTRAARKIRLRGPRGRKRSYHYDHPLRWAPFVGERCPKALGTPRWRLGQAAFGGRAANAIKASICQRAYYFFECLFCQLPLSRNGFYFFDPLRMRWVAGRPWLAWSSVSAHVTLAVNIGMSEFLGSAASLSKQSPMAVSIGVVISYLSFSYGRRRDF